jgi:hypothetical protein
MNMSMTNDNIQVELWRTIRQLLQFLWDGSVTSFNCPIDIYRVPVLLWGYESDASPLITRSARPTSAVNVVFHVIWGVKVDHQLQLLDIQTTSGDRGGDDNGNDTSFEISDGRIPVYLILTTVQRHAQVSLSHEFSQEIISGLLSVHEDQGPTFRVLVIHLTQDLQETVELRILRSNFDNLLDFCGYDGPSTNGDLQRFVEDLPGERVHLLWESGREQNSLTIGSDVIDDFHDLGFEAHVEHAVSLVKDDVSDPLQIRYAPRICGQEIDHTTRCADDDFRSFLQFSDLILDG